jgi:hypothetical protein
MPGSGARDGRQARQAHVGAFRGAAVTPTRLRTLVVAAIACALLAWLLIRASYPGLPQLPWTAAPALLLLGIAEAITGWNVRAKILGRRDDKPLAPIGVARAVALAKASSLGGAVFAGFSAGCLIYTLGLVNLPVASHDAVVAAVTLVSAIILVAAALYLEYCCRAPSRNGHDDDDPQR